MTTLVEFLLARVEEEEVVARAVHRHEGDHDNTVGLWYAEERGSAMVATSSYRILAECDARRRMIELHRGPHDDPGGPGAAAEGDAGCRTLRLLAMIYVEHPDHDPAWAIS